LCKPLEPAWILPNSRDFCIPLPAYRNSPPALRIVAPAESGQEVSTPESLPLPGAGKEVGDDQVILPFKPRSRRKPAA
ncbi:MAG: hypothetical protein ABSH20_31115, partial [Tepidisphaeraceae bacterium]